jgi:hypothetical protein
LHLDDAAVGALFEFRQESIDLLTGFNEFDFDGEMVGDFQDVRGVDAVGGSEAGHPP